MLKDIRIKLNGYYKYFNHKLLVHRNNIYRKKIRKKIKNIDFTIISNNCWGGGIYEDLYLPYKTPTVGLFFFSHCYINFIKDIKGNLSEELYFTNFSKYKKANTLRENNYYPIGIIKNTIEIHFLHYKTEEEARAKWERRKERVNLNNILLSFTDNEPYTMEELNYFDQLPYKKVFFSSKKIKNIYSLVWLKKFKNNNTIGDIYTNPQDYRKYFNVIKWLNS